MTDCDAIALTRIPSGFLTIHAELGVCEVLAFRLIYLYQSPIAFAVEIRKVGTLVKSVVIEFYLGFLIIGIWEFLC
jgi:hypothetical protein